MSLKIKIDVEREKTVARPRAELSGIFLDVEASLRKFPKLRKLSRNGEDEDSFILEMQTIGSSVAKIAHDVSFGLCCTADAEQSSLIWEPLPDVGNARLNGQLRVEGTGQSARLTFRVHGELQDVPVPLMYRLVAPAFIQGKFSALLDAYLEKLSASKKPKSGAKA